MHLITREGDMSAGKYANLHTLDAGNFVDERLCLPIQEKRNEKYPTKSEDSMISVSNRILMCEQTSCI
jgi:hypothetical protein